MTLLKSCSRGWFLPFLTQDVDAVSYSLEVRRLLKTKESWVNSGSSRYLPYYRFIPEGARDDKQLKIKPANPLI